MSETDVVRRWGMTVPGNRWDLIPPPPTPPRVSVVVPFFEQHAELERVLAGLSIQRGPVQLCDVIVADDGSVRPPTLPSHLHTANGGRVPVELVRQQDRGCRPAAARNLGAAIGRGDVFVFLDGDTVPEPDAVARLAALPAVAGEVVTVGRREYADLGSWTARRLADWLSSDRCADGPTRYPRPAWLDDAYTASADLFTIDERSYQLVIGAVMAMSRAMFEEIGGFDPTIDCYGGEDWDIAYRAYCSGGLLAHVPSAVGWHHGPDWRGREGTTATKNAERMALFERVPGATDPLVGPFPRIVVRLDARAISSDDVTMAMIATILGSGGTAVAVEVAEPSAAVARACRHDSRVHESVSDDVVRRSLVQIDVLAPTICAPGTIERLVEEVSPVAAGRLRLLDGDRTLWLVTATRALARSQRWTSGGDVDSILARLFGRTTAPAAELGVTRAGSAVDLERIFTR